VPAILFDLDGVLVDSAGVVERAWRRWAHEQQLDADEVLATVHGRRAGDIVEIFAPQLDPAQQVRRISGYEMEDGGTDLAMIPGALECVAVPASGRGDRIPARSGAVGGAPGVGHLPERDLVAHRAVERVRGARLVGRGAGRVEQVVREHEPGLDDDRLPLCRRDHVLTG
jgi:hypothetical protein